MRKLILMFAVFLYVDKPVASLQFDATLSGTITLDKIVGTQKQLVTAPVGTSGKTRIVVYGLNQSTFEGKFAELQGYIDNIGNTVGSDADGKTVQITIRMLSQPQNVTVTPNK